MGVEDATKTQEAAKPKTIAEQLKADAEDGSGPPIDLETLEKAVLSLPPEFMLDSLAAELVEHLANYHKAKAALRAARAQGDSQRITAMASLMNYSRLAAAAIQGEHPGVKAIADEIAEARALQARRQRKAMLEQDKDD